MGTNLVLTLALTLALSSNRNDSVGSIGERVKRPRTEAERGVQSLCEKHQNVENLVKKEVRFTLDENKNRP